MLQLKQECRAALEKSCVPTGCDRTAPDSSGRCNSGCRKADVRAALNEQKYPDCVRLKAGVLNWRRELRLRGPGGTKESQI
jgi:hypothetical protein